MARHDLALAQESCRGDGTFSPLLTAMKLSTLCIIYSIAMSWEIGSAWAERVGQGEVGWYTQGVKTAWPCMGWLPQ